ncbi:hypothetical protein RIF29_14850 [Crotalaria pallida]|uniref:Mediator of RNA polymerase II transcription subunit 21 n=1 Tax=Crotalaria pallida TaxID=3830 RepID=A0AAN9IC21_CROPI
MLYGAFDAAMLCAPSMLPCFLQCCHGEEVQAYVIHFIILLDAPPDKLSPNYPEPPPHLTKDEEKFLEQAKLMSAALVNASKKFDTMVDALPISEGDEEAELKRIAELQAENDAIGQELQM